MTSQLALTTFLASFALAGSSPAWAQNDEPEPNPNATTAPLSPILAQLPPRVPDETGAIPEMPPESASFDDHELAELEQQERSSHRFSNRPWLIEARVGIGTTVGELGAVLEYNLGQRAAAGAGAGVNLWGPVVGAHLRLRPIVGSRQSGRLHAFTFESAISIGRFGGFDIMPSIGEGYEERGSVAPEWMTWAQFELGWETRAPNGFSLRISSGYAFAINSPNWQCSKSNTARACKPEGLESAIPTFSVGLGYAWQ